jgi:hypothetical protein
MSLSQTFIIAMKLHINTSHSWANFINEWIASKNGIQAQQCFYTNQQTKAKLGKS